MLRLARFVLGLVSFFIVFYIAIRKLFCVTTIQLNSMAPTLQDGDRVLVLRFWPARWLRKGQIIIIWHSPLDLRAGKWPENSNIRPFIKRVAGLPGETVVTDLKKLNPSLQALHREQFDKNGIKIHPIRPGYVFVESDNPAGGLDSHCWGPLPVAGILGIVILKLSPSS